MALAEHFAVRHRAWIANVRATRMNLRTRRRVRHSFGLKEKICHEEFASMFASGGPYAIAIARMPVRVRPASVIAGSDRPRDAVPIAPS